jgi:putative flippase GtrA
MIMAGKSRAISESVSIRYLAVIACGWLVDNCVFLVAVGSLGIAVSVLLGRLAGALTGYVLHRSVTFPERVRGERSRRREVAVYAVVWVVAYFATAAGTMWLHNGLDIPPLLAKVAIELIVVPANFVLISRYAFG